MLCHVHRALQPTPAPDVLLNIPSAGTLAELAEELADVADEQIGDFHGREVAAPVVL